MALMSKPLFSRSLACLAAAICSGMLTVQAQSTAWIPGITEAINDVILSAPAAGIIGNVHSYEGEFVAAGSTIMELDKRLEELEAERRKQVFDLKKSDMESSKKLFEKTISLSREEMHKKITEFAVAQAEFELAKEQLKRRLMTAPFDGTVTGIMQEVGEACQAQQPLARLVDTRKCYFICNVEAKTRYPLKAGQTVNLEVEAGEKHEQFTGTIYFVSPVVDPASGLMRVKVIFENPEGRIKPGVAGRMLMQENKDA